MYNMDCCRGTCGDGVRMLVLRERKLKKKGELMRGQRMEQHFGETLLERELAGR